MLVLDANVVIPACTVEAGFRPFGRERLVAPPLMWSEARSSLHEAVWRGELDPGEGQRAMVRLDRSPVRAESPPELGPEAWRLADELGFAKTYDAEYLALANLLGCRLVTLDARLKRATDRLGFVVGPTEL
ncbi:MAG: type II toxin-antitoxin system VapC family toxin [Actinomycetota bacterium]